jgi:spore maturation protein CgeB
MKVLVAGDWHSDLHEAEVCKSLRRLGHEAVEFRWFHHFQFDTARPHSTDALNKRFQNKYIIGPLIAAINREFVDKVRRHRPELIFVYRGTHLWAETLQRVRDEFPNCRLVGYNNDDPFSPAQPRYVWRHFLAGVPVYDLVLAYRHANLEELRRAGARKVDLMRSWYVPDRNHPVELTEDDKKIYACDVVFVGHFEPDQRLEYLEAIVDRGYSLRLFGPSKYWQKSLERSALLSHLAPVRMVWGEDYNKALCGAKVVLCFLSKLNRDSYTRRCFEIPAARALMLSEFSPDLASLYEKGVEVDFFGAKEELLERVDFYVRQESVRADVAAAGHAKVRAAGHDIDSRISKMLETATCGH